jgi:hypothetical protein
MLDFLKELSSDVDMIKFLPHDKIKNGLEVTGEKYKENLEYIGGTTVGSAWHVILFKWNDEKGKVYDTDKFDAIFSEPREYISSLIPENWYGIFVKKTTKSDKIMNEMFDNIKSMC